MTLTKILRRAAYNTLVFSSGEFIRLPKEVVNINNYQPGHIFTDDEIFDFRQIELEEKMYFYTSLLILRRFHSSFEVRMKLNKKYGEHLLTEKIIQRATNEGLLEDKRFAQLYVHSLFLANKYSVKIVRLKLLKKGIASGVCSAVLNEYTNHMNQTEVLKKQLTKTLSRYANKNFDNKTLYKKVTESLIRKGFQYSEIKSELTLQFQDSFSL